LQHALALERMPHNERWGDQMAAKLECINPILPVRDVKVSLDYYVRVLGFQKADWVSQNATFALVSRDGFGILPFGDSR
jgi:hypothetical protein